MAKTQLFVRLPNIGKSKCFLDGHVFHSGAHGHLRPAGQCRAGEAASGGRAARLVTGQPQPLFLFISGQLKISKSGAWAFSCNITVVNIQQVTVLVTVASQFEPKLFFPHAELHFGKPVSDMSSRQNENKQTTKHL